MLDFYDGKKLNGLNKLGNYTSLNIVCFLLYEMVCLTVNPQMKKTKSRFKKIKINF